ncbi:MAG: hypothetical protein NTV63_00765 [Candidatus Woesearchaeota archaeon]|nr:hypothetical protein [Candidatus Woesearchaeota archaeon]
MRYQCKSIIIGRKDKKVEKIEDKYLETAPIFVNLCEKNDPHLTAEIPFKFLDFDVHKVVIRGLDVYYLIPGTDIIINNLSYIDIESDGPHLYISGKQAKTNPHKKEPLPAYLLKLLRGRKGKLPENQIPK